MLTRVVLPIFIIASLVAAPVAMAEGPLGNEIDYAYINAELDRLEDDHRESLDTFFSQLNTLITQADSLGHDDLSFRARSIKWDSLTTLERYEGIDVAREYYESRPDLHGDLESYMRFLNADLRHSGQSQNLERAMSVRKSLGKLASNEANPIWLRGNVLAYLADSYYDFKNNAEAIAALREAINLFSKDIDNPDRDVESLMGVALNALANVYDAEGNRDLAIQYYLQSIPISIERDEYFNLSVTYYNLAGVYNEDKQFDRALIYADKALALSQQIEDEVGIAYANTLLGNIHSDSGQADKAVTFFETAIDGFEHNQVPRAAYLAWLQLASAYAKTGELEAAQRAMDLALKQPPEHENHESKWALLSTQLSLEKAKGEFEKALEIQSQLMTLNQEEMNRQRQSNILRLIAEFELEQKDDRIDLLQTEAELKTLRLANLEAEEIRNRVIILTSIGVVLITIVLWRREAGIRQRFHELAMTDPLTQAPNRRAIMETAQKSLIQSARDNFTVSVAVVDLDHFKRVNDQFGHDVGDRVLIAFANICRDSLRKGDVFGRFGGEEWLLVLMDADKSSVEDIFERLRVKLANAKIEGLPDDYQVTLSMGSVVSKAGEDLRSMIKAADNNVYQAKQLGRDRLVV